jgi:hypothetical protein
MKQLKTNHQKLLITNRPHRGGFFMKKHPPKINEIITFETICLIFDTHFSFPHFFCFNKKRDFVNLPFCNHN